MKPMRRLQTMQNAKENSKKQLSPTRKADLWFQFHSTKRQSCETLANRQWQGLCKWRRIFKETHINTKYYLPHQAIIRPGSLTTKLRVVFDASAKTTNGLSLNDVIIAGPKIQKDIIDILIHWRKWQYVMVADIEKTYRQIKVAEKDQEIGDQ